MSLDQEESAPRWYLRILHMMIWGGGLVLAGPFLAGVAGYFVSPDHYWGLQLLGIIVPHLAGALLLTAGLAVIHGHWAYAGLLAVVIAMGLLAPMVARDSVESDALLDDVPRLVVMSFNAGMEYAGNRQDDLAALLAREQPHLVAMQELPVRLDALTGITTGPPFISPLVQGRAYPIAWPKTNNRWVVLNLPTFSRTESAGSAMLLSDGGKGGLWASGGVVRSEVEWEGQPIAIYNVHLHSFGSERPWKDGTLLSPKAWRSALHTYREDFRTRAEQARQLRWWLDQEPLPFLVCGDFNSTPANWVYGHIAHGLQDSFRAKGEGWGMTFPATWPLVRIDYVLASPHWRVHRAFVPDGLSSDHRPVIAELALVSAEGREVPAP